MRVVAIWKKLKYKVEGSCGFAPSLSYLTIEKPIFKRLIPKILGQDLWFWNEPQLSYDYGMSDLIYDNEITDNGSPSLEKDSRYLTISVFEDKLVKKIQ